MNNPESIFTVANTIALFSWVYLAAFPFRPVTHKLLLGVVITLLCVAYAALVFNALAPTDFQKFSTLAGVVSLMSSPGAALVGWIHYLAFDLMVGLFIAANAARHGINRWVILPCFLLTFMLGPVGLLLYLLIRWMYTKNYFADNF
jgi:hypothetical protein